MRGPDALGTERRGGQSTLPGAGTGKAIEPGAQAAPAQEVDEDALARMRARVMRQPSPTPES